MSGLITTRNQGCAITTFLVGSVPVTGMTLVTALVVPHVTCIGKTCVLCTWLTRLPQHVLAHL